MKRTRSLQKFAAQFGYEHKNRSNPFSGIKKHANELSKLLDNLITDRKSESIIDFAEIGEFIDMPVRTYSSGMYSKLAFSITAILETDIMLIDEVLSVGDQKFKKKSYEKMKSLISNKDRTVVIVSHSIETLKQLCDTVMWMHEGQIKRIGDPNEVLDEYVAFMEKS
mgnify:CR=1 FL=1